MLTYRVEDNLEMRLVSEHYAEEVYRAVHDNLAHLRPWLVWANEDYTADTAREFYRARLLDLAETGALSLLIFRDGKLAGGIGFDRPKEINSSTEIGYWLTKEAEGHGIVTKCCRVLLGHCFDELGLNRVAIKCAVDNVRSQAVPERLGFTLEGLERGGLRFDDRFVDLKVYSILKKEWESR